MDIVIYNDRHHEFSTFLKKRIRAYNDGHSLFHRAMRQPEAVRYLSLVVEDDDHHWLGGLSAELYWNWLEIRHFWLHEKLRGSGLGSRILEEAERRAKEQGAIRVLLQTFDFQALEFYRKAGYVIVGEVNDYPPGSTFYTMVKSLT